MNGHNKLFLTVLIVIVIGLIAWMVETVRDRKPAIYAQGWLALIGLGLAALILALSAHFGR